MSYPIDIETLEVQQFREITWGTPGTATVRRRGVKDIKIKPDNKTEAVKERRGTAVDTYLTRVTQRGGGTVEMEEYVLYEDSHYTWESLCGTATPSGANPYTRDYAAPLGSFAALVSGYRTYSLFYGDPADYAGTANGVIVQKLTLTGNTNGFLMMKSTWLAKLADTGTTNMVATASAAEIATATVAIGADVNLYVAPWGVALNEGSHAVPATALDFELEIDTQRALRRYQGNLLPQNVLFKKWQGKLKLGLELNTSSAAYMDSLADMNSEWQQQIRLKIAADANNVLRFDFAGFSQETPEMFSDNDGALKMDIEMQSKYNPTLGNWLKLQTITPMNAGALL